jgi:hypothetical protein
LTQARLTTANRTTPGRSLGAGTGQWRCACDFVWESGESCSGCHEGNPSTLHGYRSRSLRRKPKTHCRWGHALTPANSLPNRRRSRYNITPMCKTCYPSGRGKRAVICL